jgi:cytochrome c biogenesis protein CcdA
MEFGLATYSLGYAAGVLSTLSPCVLPLLPIVLGSAVGAHRWGAAALTAGLMISFATTGIFIATAGASIGLGETMFRQIGGSMLIAAGIVLLLPALQVRIAALASGMSNTGETLLAKLTLGGLRGQFIIGLILGLVWSPCVGPTLGAATVLAAQGKNIGQVALLMSVFGFGAGSPMLLLGAMSRNGMIKLRSRLLVVGHAGKKLLSVVLIVIGGLTLTGLDKALEKGALLHLPSWLVDVATRF